LGVSPLCGLSPVRPGHAKKIKRCSRSLEKGKGIYKKRRTKQGKKESQRIRKEMSKPETIKRNFGFLACFLTDGEETGGPAGSGGESKKEKRVYKRRNEREKPRSK